jgi:type IV secretion system protein VirB8
VRFCIDCKLSKSFFNAGLFLQMAFMKLFTKKTKDESVEVKKNWYADRYQTIVVQRNFLALITIASLAGIIFSILSVVQITNSKTIEPFVIEIESKTGITNVIRPLQIEKFAYDETLRRYFLTKYITNRETYNYGSFEYNYFTVVRLLSNYSVYNDFRRLVYASNSNSPVRLGQKTQRHIKLKSISFLRTIKGQIGYTAQIRFKSDDSGSNIQHKVATINFDFADLALTDEERAINPLGFQVIGYRVDDEIMQ